MAQKNNDLRAAGPFGAGRAPPRSLVLADLHPIGANNQPRPQIRHTRKRAAGGRVFLLAQRRHRAGLCGAAIWPSHWLRDGQMK